ncbi:MAG TPA: hypothetical protein VNN13_10860, partial [Methylomirabilota bacterium]|nr:hypothetical protein [Methylomirabilota bacterium]
MLAEPIYWQAAITRSQAFRRFARMLARCCQAAMMRRGNAKNDMCKSSDSRNSFLFALTAPIQVTYFALADRSS